MYPASEKVLLILNMCLQNKHGYTAEQLAEIFECTRRTAQRKINVIVEMAKDLTMFEIDYRQSEDYDCRQGNYPNVLKIKARGVK